MKKSVALIFVFVLFCSFFSMAVSGADSDDDGVLDGADLCPGTVLPETVPESFLMLGHLAGVDSDNILETKSEGVKGFVDSMPLSKTFGCSCTQILAQKPRKSEGEIRYGCSGKTVKDFINKKASIGKVQAIVTSSGRGHNKAYLLGEESFDDLWVENGVVGANFEAWGSDNFQYPLGSNNAFTSGGIRFGIRYDNTFKWAHDNWFPTALELSLIDSLHFITNTPNQKVAEGKVGDSNVEITTKVTLLTDKWYLIEYAIKNVGSSALNNVKFYQGADFDVDHVTSSNDYGARDPELGMLHIWDYDGNPYVGMASPLSPNKYDVTGWWDMWTSIRDDNLANGNSYGIGDPGIAYEWQLGTLNAGQTKTIPVVFASGSNINDLKNEIQKGLNYITPTPKLKILFIPLKWTRSQPEFATEVKKQLDFFINDISLKNCRNLVNVAVAGDVSYNDFTCETPLKKLRKFVDQNTIYKSSDFDFVVGLIDVSPCRKLDGQSNGEDTIWLTTEYEHLLAHELGHIFSLEDEYCSNLAGSTDCKCNDCGSREWQKKCDRIDPNPLDPLLGCNASEGGGCCEGWVDNKFLPNCDPTRDYPKGYRACCRGNYNSKTPKGVSTMSASDAHIHWPGARGYDNNDLAHLNTIPQLKCN